MDETMQVVIEMNEFLYNRFKKYLEDLTPEEINWRPLPEANSINLIVRHLRIEAAWHAATIEQVEPAEPPDSVPLDFERNIKETDELWARFIRGLRGTTLAGLERLSAFVYRDSPRSPSKHFFGFHQAIHLASHWGQINTIRNLYRKTRGEPARFFPENPMFPTE